MNEPGLNTAVFLKGISVSYRIPSEKVRTFKEYLIKRIQGKISLLRVLALKNLDLSIEKGEVFGILGRNGAGKSTLLKVIARVVYPTKGRVWINGIVSPMLELNAGFHPELTGIENIYLNGTLLGHTRKEIASKMDEILDFAEIGKYINAPIRTYSSGMIARLGFSIATSWTPDILLLDEVLSVGDVAFQKKCEQKMQSFIHGESTILLVTHSPKLAESLCTRAIIIDKGEIVESGTSHEISKIYQTRMNL
jgi:ABC-2 type transport system ATP-binding protein